MKEGEKGTTYMGCEANVESKTRLLGADTPKKTKRTRGGIKWTANSGRPDKSGWRSASFDPRGRHAEKKKTVNRKKPVGCIASTEVSNVGSLGHVCRRKERERKMSQEGKYLLKYLLAAKPERG